MNFAHIKDQACPTCGAAAVTDSYVSDERGPLRHTNGQVWETRRFACGLTQQWSPNFSRLTTEGTCTQSAEYKKKLSRRKDLLTKIRALIDEDSCDERFKELVGLYLPQP